jgi:DeoR/GlpR family transcriptional regulator of sugar metabolism
MQVLIDERRSVILERLESAGRVLAGDLCSELGCSVDTVRRDLRELDDAGLLRRVHGGALPRHGVGGSFAQRTERSPGAKRSIARTAAQLVRDGQVIVIDGGTTTLEVARALKPDLHATVVTTCPPIAVALADRAGLDVTVIGGSLRRGSLVTVGAETVSALRAIRADLVFLGVCGLHPTIGVTVPDIEERHVKAAMIEDAAEVVALADAEKLGTGMPFVVSALSAVSHLVTDAAVDDERLAPYRAAGIRVIGA